MRLLRRLPSLCTGGMRLLAFRFRYRFLRTDISTEEKGDVLLISMSGWVPRVLMEGMMAAGFRLLGYRPVIVTNSDMVWAKLYFRACGIRTFLFFDDLQKEAKKSFSMPNIDDIVSSATFASLFSLTHEGVDIGRHVLSTVVRSLKQGSVSFDDPAVREQLKSLLLVSYASIRAAQILFDRVHPVAVLFLERGYTPFGEIFDVALRRNLNVVQYHHGHRSDLFILTRFSVETRHRHSFSVSPESWKSILSRPWTSSDEENFMNALRRSYEEGTWFNRKFLLKGKKEKTPEEVRAQLQLDPQKKTAVIFSHVLWDATFFFGTSLFEDYEKWLIATVKVACENTNVNWIVKLHPDYMWKMKDGRSPRDVLALDTQIGTLPPHVQVVAPDTDISTHSFFKFIDYCITVRGTVGIEAPCFGIPVFTAGTGRYSGLGFTDDSASQEEYLSKIGRIQEFERLSPAETTLARRHAHALFTLRPLQITTFEMATANERKGFDYDLLIRAHSVDDLRKADDLRVFAKWVAESRDPDYVRSEPLSL